MQVAKDLKMNYSSAKSLIHYYKNNKRPAPDFISKVLHSKRQATFAALSSHKDHELKLKIEVKLNKTLVHSYNYYEALQAQEATLEE